MVTGSGKRDEHNFRADGPERKKVGSVNCETSVSPPPGSARRFNYGIKFRGSWRAGHGGWFD